VACCRPAHQRWTALLNTLRANGRPRIVSYRQAPREDAQQRAGVAAAGIGRRAARKAKRQRHDLRSRDWPHARSRSPRLISSAASTSLALRHWPAVAFAPGRRRRVRRHQRRPGASCIPGVSHAPTWRNFMPGVAQTASPVRTANRGCSQHTPWSRARPASCHCETRRKFPAAGANDSLGISAVSRLGQPSRARMLGTWGNAICGYLAYVVCQNSNISVACCQCPNTRGTERK
jgi:hypothetical protein